MHHAQVVGVNDQKTRIGGVTETLGESLGAGRRRLLSDGERKLKEKEEAEEAKQPCRRFHGDSN